MLYLAWTVLAQLLKSRTFHIRIWISGFFEKAEFWQPWTHSPAWQQLAWVTCALELAGVLTPPCFSYNQFIFCSLPGSWRHLCWHRHNLCHSSLCSLLGENCSEEIKVDQYTNSWTQVQLEVERGQSMDENRWSKVHRAVGVGISCQ